MQEVCCASSSAVSGTCCFPGLAAGECSARQARASRWRGAPAYSASSAEKEGGELPSVKGHLCVP